MKPIQISHGLNHSPSSKTGNRSDYFQTALAAIVGVFIGLLMGITALAVFLGSEAATEIGRPGMLLIKVLIVGTFVILSVILFTCGFGGGEREDS